LNDSEILTVINVFKHFDSRGDQNISFEEAVPMALAFDLTHAELLLIFNEIDQNGDG